MVIKIQVDVGKENLNITFAINAKDEDANSKGYDQPPHHEVIATRKISAFGHMYRLLTGINNEYS